MVDEDIQVKRPVLEQAIVAATEMMQQCMPEEAHILQTKVESLQSRMTQVSLFSDLCEAWQYFLIICVAISRTTDQKEVLFVLIWLHAFFS